VRFEELGCGRGEYLELDNGAGLVVVVGKKGKGELDVGA
jgi:hypothetical protein